MGLSDETIETVTGNDDPMIILIWFDAAGLPLTQFSLEVSRQDTKSSFTGAKVYVEWFVPTFSPFTFH